MTAYYTMNQTITRPVGEVFATAISLHEFPRWSPRNPWATKLTPGEIGEGTQFKMGIKGFGKVTNELREFQANKQVMVVPLITMFDGGHRWIFTDLGDGSTRIDHELEMRPKARLQAHRPAIAHERGEDRQGDCHRPAAISRSTPLTVSASSAT